MFNIGNLSPQALRQSTGLAGVVCLALVAFAPGLAAIKSGAAEMPGAEEVFQRHVEAVGGATALRKPHNLVYKGEADLIPLKVKAPIEFLVQAPDRFLLRLKYHYAFFGMIRVPFVGVRQPECGYDGTNRVDRGFRPQARTAAQQRSGVLSGAARQVFAALLQPRFPPDAHTRHRALRRALA